MFSWFITSPYFHASVLILACLPSSFQHYIHMIAQDSQPPVAGNWKTFTAPSMRIIREPLRLKNVPIANVIKFTIHSNKKKAKFHKSFIDCRLATQQNNHRLLFGKFKRLISFRSKMSLFFINGRNAFILIFLDAPEWRRYKNIDSSRVKRRSRMCKANKLGISLLRIIKHKLCNKNIYKTARNTANQTPISLLLPE